MKLEEKFFNSFFYPFLIGVLLNMIIVTIFIYIFTNNYLDKRTAQNIIDLEKKSAKININSINTLITTALLKVQASLNEQILFYQKLANRTNDIIDYNINDYLACTLNFNGEFIKNNKDKFKYMGLWFVDEKTREENLTINDTIRLQLIAFSNILPNVYSSLAAIKSNVEFISFFFEKTELLVGFPLDLNYSNYYRNLKNPSWCLDSKGELFQTFKFKCGEVYNNILKAKTGVFDLNPFDLKDRTIYVTNSYKKNENSINSIFSLYIEFNDPISGGLGYAMGDINQEDLLFAFENFNSKLSGYFLITSVGYNNVFYYPKMGSSAKTPFENIFRWDRKFYLQEKIYFMNNIQKLITSNYNKYINDDSNSLFDEIKLNGIDTSEQYFHINGDKFYFSLFPVVLENINSKKEHVLSIVYLYNYKLYYDEFKSYSSNSIIKIILEIIIFTVFGSGLLYLIVLTFNTLAKYIVIPIKNVNYMLKGIHIGGENRLDYLEFLKKKAR